MECPTDLLLFQYSYILYMVVLIGIVVPLDCVIDAACGFCFQTRLALRKKMMISSFRHLPVRESGQSGRIIVKNNRVRVLIHSIFDFCL
jgi:hypothetical protein